MNALLLIDIQNDFVPGGTLAVNGGDEIVPLVNELQRQFDLIIATQDWHPHNHLSFADNHAEKAVGDIIQLNNSDQILWPVHCVQNTRGAEFLKTLNVDSINKIVQKGTDRTIDSYSGFFDNGKLKATELDAYLKTNGVNEVYVAGLATDYCVKFTALDAMALGYRTVVIIDACRGVNLNPDDIDLAIEEMKNKGIEIINGDQIIL